MKNHGILKFIKRTYFKLKFHQFWKLAEALFAKKHETGFIVNVSLSHWYPGSGVVLDCIDPDLCPLSYFYIRVVVSVMCGDPKDSLRTFI